MAEALLHCLRMSADLSHQPSSAVPKRVERNCVQSGGAHRGVPHPSSEVCPTKGTARRSLENEVLGVRPLRPGQMVSEHGDDKWWDTDGTATRRALHVRGSDD